MSVDDRVEHLQCLARLVDAARPCVFGQLADILTDSKIRWCPIVVVSTDARSVANAACLLAHILQYHDFQNGYILMGSCAKIVLVSLDPALPDLQMLVPSGF